MKQQELSESLSVWCGLLISMGALAYTVVGGPIGALLFAFGLITVINIGKRNLYTGWVGICRYDKDDWLKLFYMLTLNGVGVLLGVVLALMSNIDIDNTIRHIVDTRLNTPLISIFTRSIYTGVIMHVCVWMAIHKQTIIPTLIGVPLFILCGLPHCIADIFYYGMSLKLGWDNWIVVVWVISVLGNTIGCKIPSWIDKDLNK